MLPCVASYVHRKSGVEREKTQEYLYNKLVNGGEEIHIYNTSKNNNNMFKHPVQTAMLSCIMYIEYLRTNFGGNNLRINF